MFFSLRLAGVCNLSIRPISRTVPHRSVSGESNEPSPLGQARAGWLEHLISGVTVETLATDRGLASCSGYHCGRAHRWRGRCHSPPRGVTAVPVGRVTSRPPPRPAAPRPRAPAARPRTLPGPYGAAGRAWLRGARGPRLAGVVSCLQRSLDALGQATPATGSNRNGGLDATASLGSRWPSSASSRPPSAAPSAAEMESDRGNGCRGA